MYPENQTHPCTRHRTKRSVLGPLLFGFILMATSVSAAGTANWQGDYATAEGFRLQRDSTGYHLPSAIAFVPQPGPDPKDPLYFVTELRGTIKVVSNDRTVSTFAEGLQNLIPQRELPDHLGEIGMAGICLEPEHGYVFVTYAYQDESGIFRNAIMRFETKPRVFALKPTGRKLIAPILAGFVSNVSHQIGPLAAVDGKLFVNIGDSLAGVEARDLDFPNGKILRMTLDGLPLRDNPWAVDADPQRMRNYLWAVGFRNPFSLCAVNGRLFAAENGLDLDRFVEVQRGADFLYGGDADASGANALYVWSPAVSPVQVAYDATGNGTADFPQQWRDKFFIALAGSPTDDPGPDHRRKSVVSLGVDFEHNRLAQTPRQILRYIGPNKQLVVGVAVGPDGLYVVPMLPDAEGVTAILHLDYKPDGMHPHLLRKPRTAQELVTAKCMVCHRIDGRGLGSAAPALSRLTLAERVLEQIENPKYLDQLREIDALSPEPFIRYRKAREEIRTATGLEKARLWIKYRLLEPKFDRTVVAMPNLGLTEDEAETIASWMIEPSTGERLQLHVRPLLGVEAKRSMMMFGTGALAGSLVAAGLAYLLLRRRLRR